MKAHTPLHQARTVEHHAKEMALLADQLRRFAHRSVKLDVLPLDPEIVQFLLLDLEKHLIHLKQEAGLKRNAAERDWRAAEHEQAQLLGLMEKLLT